MWICLSGKKEKKFMKLKDWLKINRKTFKECDLRFLIKDVLSLNRSLIQEEDTCLKGEEIERLKEIKEAYIRGVPLAYILGKEDFFGREFKVNRSVLIPRKETELIAEKAIDIINKNHLKNILDLCSGSGNLGLTIKKEIKEDLLVVSSDISWKSLLTAKSNREFYNEDVKLVNADLLDAFKGGSFDLIVSNPPYVESENIKGPLLFEPRLALEAGADGLYFINKILKQAPCYLKDKGYLIIEIGYKHKKKVEEFINNAAFYEQKEWIKDYSGIFRGVVCRLNKKL